MTRDNFERHKVGDVVWCRARSKCAVVKSVNDTDYDIRTYDGDTFVATDSELGRK
jgi:hypothetical protein